MGTLQVFAATQETQGRRTNDFCFVPEGELVTFPLLVCGNEETDGHCGCARALTGTKSLKGTTTAQVVRWKQNHHALARVLYKALASAFPNAIESNDLADKNWQWARETATELLREAAQFPLGTIVEYRDEIFVARPQEG